MDARANAQRLSRSAAVACLRVLTRNGFRASVLNPLLVGINYIKKLYTTSSKHYILWACYLPWLTPNPPLTQNTKAR
jgi:hypothetical protein